MYRPLAELLRMHITVRMKEVVGTSRLAVC